MIAEVHICPFSNRWLTPAYAGWADVMCDVYAQKEEA